LTANTGPNKGTIKEDNATIEFKEEFLPLACERSV